MLAYVIKKLYFCSTIQYKHMLTAPTRERGYVPMSHDYESEVYYTREEFMDELAKQLGQAYGLNDIREAC